MNEIGDENLNKFLWKYKEALKFLENQIGSFVSKMDAKGEYNPIEHFSGRIKSIDSIKGKLNRRGLEFSVDSITNNLEDIAGVRIVCHFMNDLNKMIEFIHKNPFIEVIEVEDYISNPKDSGYLSYHMTVKVPVMDDNHIIYVPAEIQIRTMAMDMWASLEHKISYKHDLDKKISDKGVYYKIRSIIKNTSLETIKIDMELKNIIDELEKNDENVLEGESYNISSDVVSSDVMEKYNLGLNNLKCIINEIFSGFNEEEKKSIELLKFRLKEPKSICKKLMSKNIYNVDESTIDNNLNDVIGGRIVCSFLSDMNAIIAAIVEYFGASNVRIKDYVTNPKPNGYSSYHILVKIPVYYKGKTEFLNAEIQVRTKAMNMWASFHHKLCYKKEISSNDMENIRIAGILRDWALKISKIDEEYDNIYRSIKNNNILNDINVNGETKVNSKKRCLVKC